MRWRSENSFRSIVACTLALCLAVLGAGVCLAATDTPAAHSTRPIHNLSHLTTLASQDLRKMIAGDGREPAIL